MRASTVMGWLGLAIVAVLGFGVWYSCLSFKDHRANADVEFCAKNREYYETFCKAYPDNCKEGPRKLARCEP